MYTIMDETYYFVNTSEESHREVVLGMEVAEKVLVQA